MMLIFVIHAKSRCCIRQRKTIVAAGLDTWLVGRNLCVRVWGHKHNLSVELGDAGDIKSRVGRVLQSSYR